MSLDTEKTTPESTDKETGTEKIKQVAKQDILDLSNDEHLQNMKDMYGETEDSFIKWVRGNEDYAKKCQKMSDKEVLEFAKTDLGLKEYHSKVIDKKINAPKEEKKIEAKPEQTKEAIKTAPKEESKKEENKPAEKPVEAKKEAEKKPDDKKETKKHFRSNRFKKKENKESKEKKPGLLSRVGSWIGKWIKAIPHQTWNLLSYAPRVARSTAKYIGFDWINHGLNKPGLKKNRDNYASKWKWEQAAKQK